MDDTTNKPKGLMSTWKGTALITLGVFTCLLALGVAGMGIKGDFNKPEPPIGIPEPYPYQVPYPGPDVEPYPLPGPIQPEPRPIEPNDSPGFTR